MQGFSTVAGNLLAIVERMQAPVPATARPEQLIATKQAPLHGSKPYPHLKTQVVVPHPTPLTIPAFQTSTTDYVSADQGPGEWGPTKYIVNVSAGQMNISSMARRPLENHYSGEGKVKPLKTKLH